MQKYGDRVKISEYQMKDNKLTIVNILFAILSEITVWVKINYSCI